MGKLNRKYPTAKLLAVLQICFRELVWHFALFFSHSEVSTSKCQSEKKSLWCLGMLTLNWLHVPALLSHTITPQKRQRQWVQLAPHAACSVTNNSSKTCWCSFDVVPLEGCVVKMVNLRWMRWINSPNSSSMPVPQSKQEQEAGK